MENHDKIYKQFETAARNSEDKKGFDRMDAVWNRVEEKLDRNKERRAARLWKYTGIAALLLLFVTIGFEMTKSKNTLEPNVNPEQNITVIDTQKVKEAFPPKTELHNAQEQVVVSELNNQTVGSTNALKDDKVLGTNGSYIVEGDSVHFTAKRKIGKVWSSRSDKSTAWIRDNSEKTAAEEAPKAEELAKSKETTWADKETATTNYTGIIIENSTGLPLPGVTVIVKRTANTVQTDLDGKFSIQAQKGEILAISYIGFQTQEIKLGDKLALNIMLQEDASTLEEVVVVGYGTTVKEAFTGSATKIDAKDLEFKTPSDNSGFIKGDIAAGYSTTSKGYDDTNSKVGVIIRPKVTQNNLQGIALKSLSERAKEDGKKALAVYDITVGVNYELEKEAEKPVASTGGLGAIRANSNPLYIINGTEVNPDIIDQIDPAYIKSFKVIKETEAVKLYGGKAANGAIIVKTKKLGGAKKKKFEELVQEYKLSDKDLNTYDGYSKIPVDSEEYGVFEENKFESPVTTPLSTFSIDVDNASYTNVRRFINMGQMVPKDAVRVEEMINFFKYDYPQPKGDDPFSINTEYSECPWNPQHKLLKIGLKGKEYKKRDLPSSNFVFLIDVSGSMADANKLPMLKKNMKVLVEKMRSEDQIAIVVYAGAAEVLLPSTSGDEKQVILNALSKLEANGTTAGGDGIKLAYETAEENFIEDGNNRVIMATDGDFNVGASSDAEMETLIEEKRKSGVFLTCLGYGMGNYKDSKLETLADKGNGNYAYIDTDEEADRFLGKEFVGSMYAIAKDVKIQIEFNPLHVQSYRLIGYENRKLNDEDFANDSVDAGELGSGHTVTALYEIIPQGVKSSFAVAADLKYSNTGPRNSATYQDELATIKFRYKKPDGDVSKQITAIIPDKFKSLDDASGDFKFAAAVAWFGLKLRDSKLVPDKKAAAIIQLARDANLKDKEGYREEFINLVNRVE
ncbi:YfbK domain-containing protein [Flavobacterium sp. RHBU_24]|uniref:YfbK domain-containing protein n=1 Tax=Flavobacterium sp. RHBU_24 TaxID=3391185 RepID=UPI003984DF98